MVVETIQSHAINAVYGAFLAYTSGFRGVILMSIVGTGCLRGLCHPELRHGYKKKHDGPCNCRLFINVSHSYYPLDRWRY
ncbi:hypothetical protein AC1031_016280 [Aphanomyces cochlioides]|nr:hypothetical protein AC1031_016280 [Aphanomyces cochlioides]